MKQNRTLVYAMAIMVVCAVFSGCVGKSAPTRFYLLNSDDPPGQAERIDGSEKRMMIGIGPVEMPAYLDRPQVVTRIGPNRLNIPEFDHWAEPLKDTFSRLLVEGLSNLLGRESMIVFPFRGGWDLEYQVPVDVIRMDGSESGDAVLVVRWMVLNEKNKKILSTHVMIYKEGFDRLDFETFAAAQSRNLASLCQDISEAILIQSKAR